MNTICDDGGLADFIDRLDETLASLDKNSAGHKKLTKKWAHLVELDESNRCILEKHKRFT
jgi:hypothetical protein